MINCNPETVSTDYDTSDRLYFEPLSPEEVLAVIDREQPEGVVTQFGGQTPLRLARWIEGAGYRIMGTPHAAIDLAEDRAALRRAGRGARHPLPAVGDRARAPTRRSPPPPRSATRCSCAPRTCSAGAPCASATTTSSSARRWPRCRARCCSTASSRTRSRSTSTRSATARRCTSPPSCSTSRRRACTPATPPACCPRSRSRSRTRSRSSTSSSGSRPRSAWSGCSTSSSRSPTPPSTCWRRTRAPHAPSRSPRRRSGSTSSRRPASSRPARRCASSTCRRRAPQQVSVKAAVLPFARFPGSDPILGPEMRSTGEVMASASDLPTALRQGRARRRPAAPDGRHGVHLRQRRRQARRRADRRGARRPRLRARGDRGNRGDAARRRPRGGGGREGGRRRRDRADRRRPRSARAAAT